MCKDPELFPDPDGLVRAIRAPLLNVFPPALLGRLVVIPYYPLSDAVLADIVRLQLRRIEKRILENHNVDFSCDENVVKLVISRCTEHESGGRMIDAILTNTILPRISQEILTCIMEGRTITQVKVSVREEEFEYAFE